MVFSENKLKQLRTLLRRKLYEEINILLHSISSGEPLKGHSKRLKKIKSLEKLIREYNAARAELEKQKDSVQKFQDTLLGMKAWIEKDYGGLQET